MPSEERVTDTNGRERRKAVFTDKMEEDDGEQVDEEEEDEEDDEEGEDEEDDEEGDDESDSGSEEESDEESIPKEKTAKKRKLVFVFPSFYFICLLTSLSSNILEDHKS